MILNFAGSISHQYIAPSSKGMLEVYLGTVGKGVDE